MTDIEADSIVKKLNDKNIKAELLADYSGKKLFGERTMAVVVSDGLEAMSVEYVYPEISKYNKDIYGAERIWY